MIKFWKFVTFHDFLSSADIFQHNFFQNILSGITTECQSNSLGPDQAGHSITPVLDPNCLQRLSADQKFAARRLRVEKNKFSDYQAFKCPPTEK